MSITIVQERFRSYHCENEQDEENALKEILQEIALLALSRAGFFRKAAFHGGTALRVLYTLQRFSEDLDFLLLQRDSHFELGVYLKSLVSEFALYGCLLEIQDRAQADETVKKAFLKESSMGKVLNLSYAKDLRRRKKLRIKIEVDTNPPQGAIFETKHHEFPHPFSITTLDMPTSFAGKSHALLCRQFVKGRDWYDFIWYVARKIAINFEFLANACEQQGPWKNQKFKLDKAWYLKEMERKILDIDWEQAKAEMPRFVKGPDLKSLELWGIDFFLDCLESMKAYL